MKFHEVPYEQCQRLSKIVNGHVEAQSTQLQSFRNAACRTSSVLSTTSRCLIMPRLAAVQGFNSVTAFIGCSQSITCAQNGQKNTRTKLVMELSSPRPFHPASPGTLADTFSGVTVPMYLSIFALMQLTKKIDRLQS